MPHSTEPFSLLKRRLRDSAMANAIAAQKIAQINNVNDVHAFTLGMLLDVGRIALVRLYLKTFEQIWQRKVQLARNENQKDLHTALLEHHYEWHHDITCGSAASVPAARARRAR